MGRESAPQDKKRAGGESLPDSARADSHISRRLILGTGAAAALYSVAHMKTGELNGTVPANPTEAKQEALRGIEESKPQTFDTGRLAGYRISGLFKDYLGDPTLAYAEPARHAANERGASQTKRRPAHHAVHAAHHGPENVIPHKLTLNFPRALNALWERKVALIKDAGKDPSLAEADAADRVMGYAERWNHPENHGGTPDAALGRTGILETVESLDARLDAVKKIFTSGEGLAYFEESRHYQIRTTEQARAFSTLIERISATMVTSYAMTELFPSANGELNVLFYDFMLWTAGKEFLAAIPSLGDLIESIGQYQGTKYAVQDTTPGMVSWSDVKIVREAASVPNAILPPGLAIPKNISDLYKFEDDSTMAYLYAVHVIARAVSVLPRSALDAFESMDDETLVAFVATSHNSPTKALHAMALWLHEKTQGRPSNDFAEYLKLSIRPYATKTRANYSALKTVQREQKDRQVAAARG